VIFVTVGTPQQSNGKIELSMIKKATAAIGKMVEKTKKNPIILIKSTVIPGTIENIVLPILEKQSGKKPNKDFGVISNPEFLQESNAIHDTKYPHAIILGGPETKYMKKAKTFFSKIHPNVKIIITKYQTAEIIKYANNSFLATKISFINQLSNICQNIPNANIDDVAKVIGLDPRIGKLFLSAGPGYGGSCLPKDMSALISFAGSVGVNPTFLKAVEKTNLEQVDNILSLMEKTLGNLTSKKITILGIAFKPNTNDIRASKSVELIKKLLKNKAKITVHDPKALENTKKMFGKKIEYAKTLADALDKSHCAVIMTQWKQYNQLNKNSLKPMKRKIIIDSRRVLMGKELGGKYFAVGVGKQS
jgi:UDPglucose 6-dehydrogenase